MAISRRAFLRRAAALGAVVTLPVLSHCTGDSLPVYDYDGPLGPEDLFRHGVASGDPLADAVVLWTHVSAGEEHAGSPLEVFVEIARDPAFEERVSAGTHQALPERGYALKLDATELEPSTTYYYRFWCLGRSSPIGRTRTAGPSTHVRLAVCACSNYAYGFFHAYRHLAERADLDAVLHLGDYIYEYGSGEYGGLRPYEPEYEILTLDDYRTRYAQYRRDPDLQEAHRQHPWITVWDDHEFANNPFAGGAANHQDDEGDWEERVTAAVTAYDEWMPTRTDDPRRIYRELAYGDLAHLLLLDIKHPLVTPGATDPDSMLGDEQSAWADDRIAASSAQWLLLCQQQTFATLVREDGSGGSAWDAFPDSRTRIAEAVADAGIRNVVVLTGDIHKARALDVTEDPFGAYDPATGAGSWAVEAVCSSVTSPGKSSDLSALPHHRWTDHTARGYLVVDLTPEGVHLDWFGFDDLLKLVELLPEERWVRGFYSSEGTNHLVASDAPAAVKEAAPPLAPS